MYRLLMHSTDGAKVTTNLLYTWQQINSLSHRFNDAGKYTETRGQYAELSDYSLQWDVKKETLSDYTNPKSETFYTLTLYTPYRAYPCIGISTSSLKDAWNAAYSNYRRASRTDCAS